VGSLAEERDRAAAEEIDGDWTEVEIPKKAEKEGYFCIEVDGSQINTVVRTAGTTWKENKLGLIYTSDNMKEVGKKKRKEIKKRDYATYLGGVDEFEKRLFECALRNGYGQYKTDILLGDGAPWIWNMGEDIFPGAVQILDFYHLSENIHTFGKFLFGEGTAEYKAWAGELTELAWDSRTGELLERIEPYKDRERPVGVPNLWHYVTENKGRIDYKRYRENGWPVGSGAIESSNKKVPQSRCKGPGMRWKPVHAQQVLALKARHEAARWYEVPALLAA
jgi:hypothetical protein